MSFAASIWYPLTWFCNFFFLFKASFISSSFSNFLSSFALISLLYPYLSRLILSNFSSASSIIFFCYSKASYAISCISYKKSFLSYSFSLLVMASSLFLLIICCSFSFFITIFTSSLFVCTFLSSSTCWSSTCFSIL